MWHGVERNLHVGIEMRLALEQWSTRPHSRPHARTFLRPHVKTYTPHPLPIAHQIDLGIRLLGCMYRYQW